MSDAREFRVWRGDATGGDFVDYRVDVDPGMVVLDALHRIQAREASDLAVRWNCKAGKCGSCSMEINGRPRLSCMTRMNSLPADEPVTVQPLKAFPLIKDLVTDVSWNYAQNRRIRPFAPRAREADGSRRMYQQDVERVQEFRKCIECYLCQDVCHVLRDRDGRDRFIGPRFLLRAASLEMHPLDGADRLPALKQELGCGMCNITRCCTESARTHHDHRQCDHPAEGTDRGQVPRPAAYAVAALAGQPAE
jgi:succinate dehydrogenase / fumarate reductase iron-sulfur subunit